MVPNHMVASPSSIPRDPAEALASQACIGPRVVFRWETSRLKDDSPNLHGLEGKDLERIRVEAFHVDYEQRRGGHIAVWQQAPQLPAAGARRVSRLHILIDGQA